MYVHGLVAGCSVPFSGIGCWVMVARLFYQLSTSGSERDKFQFIHLSEPRHRPQETPRFQHGSRRLCGCQFIFHAWASSQLHALPLPRDTSDLLVGVDGVCAQLTTTVTEVIFDLCRASRGAPNGAIGVRQRSPSHALGQTSINLLHKDANIETADASGSKYGESLDACVAAKLVVRSAITEQPAFAVDSHALPTPMAKNLPARTTSARKPLAPGDRRAVPCCVWCMAQGRTSPCSSQKGKGLGDSCNMCASQGCTCEPVDEQLVDLAAAVGAAFATLAATSAAYDKAAAALKKQKKGKDKTAAAAPAFEPAPGPAAAVTPTVIAAAKAAAHIAA
ncbi:hypothetical protein BR93DRAFT_941304 [Coniochaeta sp. PMI_546]|nr:hypothetical protein BR93DRAFT_941304 [Coniochaeta sp. PMI_546]